MRGRLAATISVPLCCFMAAASAQTPHSDDNSFFRDPDKPFVYLKFDHIGTGVRRSENEPSTILSYSSFDLPDEVHAAFEKSP